MTRAKVVFRRPPLLCALVINPKPTVFSPFTKQQDLFPQIGPFTARYASRPSSIQRLAGNPTCFASRTSPGTRPYRGLTPAPANTQSPGHSPSYIPVENPAARTPSKPHRPLDNDSGNPGVYKTSSPRRFSNGRLLRLFSTSQLCLLNTTTGDPWPNGPGSVCTLNPVNTHSPGPSATTARYPRRPLHYAYFRPLLPYMAPHYLHVTSLAPPGAAVPPPFVFSLPNSLISLRLRTSTSQSPFRNVTPAPNRVFWSYSSLQPHYPANCSKSNNASTHHPRRNSNSLLRDPYHTDFDFTFRYSTPLEAHPIITPVSTISPSFFEKQLQGSFTTS
ncbi:hypothetical protein GOBAR_AA34390 [Gossypium barbadense]|uniref:Uncharacterized protein n=1 Tax=Gossypium barbadense TaxID=3634 RepID=A0A2P5W5D5_GOSBA|nr:hypothetical protein GOBAR_AA34390 [Gossypium barbadense]